LTHSARQEAADAEKQHQAVKRAAFGATPDKEKGFSAVKKQVSPTCQDW
jgi:hypothetical protein